MAKKPKHLVCTHCYLGQDLVPKQTFLGFFKFSCQQCNEESTYPLSTGYRIIYAVAIALFFVGLAFGRVQAMVLGIAGLIALAYDWNIRRTAKAAEANEQSQGEVIARVFE